MVALFSWLQATWRDCGLRRVTTQERRTCVADRSVNVMNFL
jgi:hypothetical protein